MLKGILTVILAMLCGVSFADSIEMGKKIYTDVIISGATKDKIWFLQTDSIDTSKPITDVTKLSIDSFPEFNRAEELAEQGQYPQAMKQYLEAYKSVGTIRDVWRKLSLEHLSKGQKKLSDTLDANAKSEWIKDLIKFRHARAKGLQSGEIDAAGPDEKVSAAPSDGDAKFCPECRGKGKIKCERCNGSGKQKCSHMVDGENHANYYEICPTCKGKGFELEYYTVEVWVKDTNRSHYYYRNSGHYEQRQKSRKVHCSNPNCKPYPKDPKLFVVWMCPYCATATPVGYIDCPYCVKGRLECTKCGGTGKLASNTAAPAAGSSAPTAAAPAPVAVVNELDSPATLLNSIEKAAGEKLPRSPYKNYEENELKRQKDRETFDQTIEPFIIASQQYAGKGVTWKATVERVSKVQRNSFIITANVVRDNANADIWTIKAIVPAKYAEVGEKLSSNSPVEISGKISGIDYKYETITLNGDEIKIAD